METAIKRPTYKQLEFNFENAIILATADCGWGGQRNGGQTGCAAPDDDCCPDCGTKLKVSPQGELWVCNHCGYISYGD